MAVTMNQGMVRQSFIRVMLLFISILLLIAVLVYQQTKAQNTELENQRLGLMELNRELDNMARLSSALTMLDELTIDEKTSTRLNLLRHLGLEQSGYMFEVASKQTRQMNNVALYLRQVNIRADIPYRTALGLADRLHNTRKVVLNTVQLEPSPTPGDNVLISIKGTIYGLEKN